MVSRFEYPVIDGRRCVDCGSPARQILGYPPVFLCLKVTCEASYWRRFADEDWISRSLLNEVLCRSFELGALEVSR